MYYKLSPEYALRRWKNTGTVLLNLKTRQMMGLDLFSFITIRQCDGVTKCDPNDEILINFKEKNIIVPCNYSDEIAELQKYKSYPNEYFPIVQWAITNRCNYMCKHCFMMVSAEKNETFEPTHEQCMNIIDQFDECGIKNIYITGGEPLLRSDFLSIVDKLIEKDIHIDIISTNGALIDENLLSEIKKRGIKPAFAVSFDGVGCHDWLRGVKGAEEASIRAIKMLSESGFFVIVEMAVHKGNAGVVLKTADLIHSCGAQVFKTIRVAESPRWKEMSAGNSLTAEQYYDILLDLLKTGIRRKWKMDIKAVGALYYYHESGWCDILPMKGLPADNDTTVLCKKARQILFVSGDGRLLPCNPFTGITSGKEAWGNIYDTSLTSLLTQSDYLDKVNAKVQMLKNRDEKCRNCKWLKYCLGGCRACAYAVSLDYLAADLTKCAFFEGGYAEKIREIVGKEKCTTEF